VCYTISVKGRGEGAKMITLKLTLITMIACSSILPMNMENMHTPTVQPKVQIEMVNEDILPIDSVSREEEFTGINQDKTYEQCMKEAFERVYEEINRLLDQIPDQADEQFQLRRMM
jgi:hypothetical protein